MQAVILAGGLGTRLSEETTIKPKPMVEIGGKPIIWHIMKSYETHGITDFIICCGYKGEILKEYFANYRYHNSDIRIDLDASECSILKNNSEPWSITLVDTGEQSMTGGRLRRIKKYINNKTFCMTYGDGVSDVDISSSIKAHHRSKCLATLTAVRPPGRFGALELTNDGKVQNFKEKPTGDGDWINGGFFVLNTDVIDLIEADNTVWEDYPLSTLAAKGELNAYFHEGFWQPMDTVRDKTYLERLWSEGHAEWKIWK